MTISTAPTLCVFNTLSDEHDVIVAPDNRHAPAFQAGDLLVIDPASKAPQPGGFFAVVYRQRGERDEDPPRPILSVEQCRRFALGRGGYVLGASEPSCRRRETVDGIYDRRQFMAAVQGRIVGILRN